MKVLFARVGYMKFYQGPQKGDERPIGGGAYNKDKIGHEAYNYLDIKDHVYGYFQPHMAEPYEIKLQRIDPTSKPTADKINDVLVVWFAKNPAGSGQVIVGWFTNATVYRSVQDGSGMKARSEFSYYVVAKTANSTLLPIGKRKYPVGHGLKNTKEGNPGQANAFYVYDNQLKVKNANDKHNSWIYDAIKYVNNYSGPKIATFEDEVVEEIETSLFSTGGQGFLSDVEKRLIIEEYAMGCCRNHFEREGYSVEDVSKTKPYDFHVTKDGKELMVEVKGTQTDAKSIILTKNEVELSRKYGNKMALFLVHSIEVNKKSVKKGSGTVRVIRPWQVIDSRLVPTSFIYDFS
jgi:hypothetical protein